MVKLIGITYSENYDDGRAEGYSSTVATFDTRELAVDYVKKSTLKSLYGNRFKKKSVLSSYDTYEIEEIKEDPPHNPEIG